MKKTILLGAILTSGSLMFAQGSQITSASTKLGSDVPAAKKFIDEAGQIIKDKQAKGEEVKAKFIPKYHYYRFKIYSEAAKAEADGTKKMALYNEAIKSYASCVETDKKGMYKTDLSKAVYFVDSSIRDFGINAYNGKDFKTAYSVFEILTKFAEARNEDATEFIKNAAISATLAKDYHVAISYYEKLIAIEEKAETPSEDGYTHYTSLANAYRKSDMMDESVQILEKAKARYGENIDILIAEAEHYLQTKNQKKAMEVLDKATQKEGTNAQLFHALAYSINSIAHPDNSADEPAWDQYIILTDKAAAAYNKAIELDPEKFESCAELGVLNFNIGGKINNNAQDISDNNKYKAEMAKSKEYFKKAQVALEQAYNLKQDDAFVLTNLRMVYAQLSMFDKANEIKAKLEALNQ